MRKHVFRFFLIMAFCILSGCGDNSQPSLLRVAIPYSDLILDYDTNYYINWLEEMNDCEIEPVIIRYHDSKEYLDTLFSSNVDIDIVMFGNDFQITDEEVYAYVQNGDIYCSDDGIYYYPNYGTTKISGVGQTLWINSDWLSYCNLPIPTTTDEFMQTLEAFRAMDPNSNQRSDEILLLGCTSKYCYNPVELLMNSYVYNDPYHSRYYQNDGVTFYAPKSDAFKEGLEYCHLLYEKELLDSRSFSISYSEFRELINSKENLVGAFTTDSISNVIYQGNPEIMARYIYVPPLKGPNGEQNALYYEKESSVGAIITSDSKNKELAEKVLQCMLTSKASLIARFGEEGEDWEYANGLDVSIYGDKSTISTINYIWNVSQNKHLNGIGPLCVPNDYLAGITWNGLNSDSEYIDARAEMAYSPYFPDEVSQKTYESIGTHYVDQSMIDFVTGNRDFSYKSWKNFLDGLYME